MSIEKMREEFKQALHAQKEFKLSAEAIAAAEWAWQASRAAVEVELPTEYDCRGGTTSYEVREMAIDAVEAAGLKVKP